MRVPRGRRRTSLTATLVLSLLLATILALTVRSLQRSQHVDLLRDTEHQPRYNERLAAQMDLPKKFVTQEKRDYMHETEDVEKSQSRLQPTATQSGSMTVREGMDGTQDTGEGVRNNLETSSNSKESQMNDQKVEVEVEEGEEEEGVAKNERTELERGNDADGTEGSADRKEEGADEMEEEDIDKEIDQRLEEERNQLVQNVQDAKSGKDEAEEEEFDREEEYNNGVERSGSRKGGSAVYEDGVELEQEKETEKENPGVGQDRQADEENDEAEDYSQEDRGQNMAVKQATSEADRSGDSGVTGRVSHMEDNVGRQGSQNAQDRNFEAQAIKAGVDSKETSGHQQPHDQIPKDNTALDAEQENSADFATAMDEKASESAAHVGQVGDSSAHAIGEESEPKVSKINGASTVHDKMLEDYYDEQYNEHYEDEKNGFVKRKKHLEDEELADQEQADASGNNSEVNSLDPELLAKQQEEFESWIEEQDAKAASIRSQAKKEAAENKQVEMKPMGNNQSKPNSNVEDDEYDHYDPADDEDKNAVDQVLPGTQNAEEDKAADIGGNAASQNVIRAGRESVDNMDTSETVSSERSVADTTGAKTREQSTVQVDASGRETGETVGDEEEDENEEIEKELEGMNEYVEI